MKNVKMNWVQTPYYRNGSVGIKGLVAFDCFIEQDVFNIVQKHYKGTILKNGKKTAIYTSLVVADLLENGVNVDLDGVNVKYAQYLSNEDIIKQSQKSTNSHVARLANLYHSVQEQLNAAKNFKNQLDTLFEGKSFIVTAKKEPANINWQTFSVGGVDYTFDFKYGVERRQEWDETSHESFSMHYTYRATSPDKMEKLKQLIELATTSKPIAYNEDFAWQKGFDAKTYELYEKPNRNSFKV